MEFVICPECGHPFMWDGIGTHDVCPSFGCKKEVNCIDNIVTAQEFYDKRTNKLNERLARHSQNVRESENGD